jgi:hypothetical protein
MIDQKGQAEILRRQAEQLRAAASTCRYNISHLGWTYCTVTVDFENNRVISFEEAEAYANELEKGTGAPASPWRTACQSGISSSK